VTCEAVRSQVFCCRVLSLPTIAAAQEQPASRFTQQEVLLLEAEVTEQSAAADAHYDRAVGVQQVGAPLSAGVRLT
jgi:hypothetical protein